MREIKFRQPILKLDGTFDHFCYWGIFPGEFRGRDMSGYPKGDDQQYTGFKDKNGKEVYEGDIREGRYHCGTEPTEYVARQTIIWDQSRLCFEWDGQYIPDFIDIEVIGNIYENPELLEVKS